MLFAGSDEKSVALLKQDEEKFNLKQEHGGLKPLVKNPKDSANVTAFTHAEQNTLFFRNNGFSGTPTLFFKDKNGQPMIYPGYANPQQMKALLAKISNKW